MSAIREKRHFGKTKTHPNAIGHLVSVLQFLREPRFNRTLPCIGEPLFRMFGFSVFPSFGVHLSMCAPEHIYRYLYWHDSRSHRGPPHNMQHKWRYKCLEARKQNLPQVSMRCFVSLLLGRKFPVFSSVILKKATSYNSSVQELTSCVHLGDDFTHCLCIVFRQLCIDCRPLLRLRVNHRQWQVVALS